MNNITKALHIPTKDKEAKPTQEELIEEAVSAANKEKDKKVEKYKAKAKEAEETVTNTRDVLKKLVLVARLSPTQFFELLNADYENWELDDLKEIATSMYDALEKAKQAKAEQANDPDGSKEPSTAQNLYTYCMKDTDAEKKTVVQVITELHKELALFEEVAGLMNEEEKFSTELDDLKKEVLKGTETGEMKELSEAAAKASI